MSYDIALYRRDFLKRAIETGLGDWTGADPISPDVMRALIAAVEAAGFVRFTTEGEAAHVPNEDGFDAGIEFNLDTPTVLAQLTAFPGEIAISIPYGDRVGASIEFCNQMARRLAVEHGLGFHDPQTDEAIYD